MHYDPLHNLSPKIVESATRIKLLICDVDGVLSDGKVYYTNQGEELKNFNIKDGFGIKQAMTHGIEIAIITGRRSQIVEKRAKELGIQYCFQGKVDKRAAFSELLKLLQIEACEVAHIGDDLPDLPLMQQAGLGIAVADAHPLTLQKADWITQAKGGTGAVREVIDALLAAQNKYAAACAPYFKFEQSSY